MQPSSVEDFSGPTKPSGDQICFQNCPVCGSSKWKTYLNPTTGGWFCFAGGHSGGGNVEGSLSASPGAEILGMLDNVRHGHTLIGSRPEIELPPWHAITKAARRYLHKRGVCDEQIEAHGLVEWEDEYRILVPYFDGGRLIYYNSRRYSARLGDGPKYKAAPGQHPLYHLRGLNSLGLLASRPGSYLLVVEGAFDAIAATAAGYDSVALGGKHLPRYLEKDLLRIAKDYAILLVALDADALADAYKIRDRLDHKVNMKLLVLPKGEDPASLGTEDLKEMIEHAAR